MGDDKAVICAIVFFGILGLFFLVWLLLIFIEGQINNFYVWDLKKREINGRKIQQAEGESGREEDRQSPQ